MLTIPGLLSEEECHRVVLDAEARGFASISPNTLAVSASVKGV